MIGDGRNTGHGHVWPRPDGYRARCGGPGLCAICSREASVRDRPTGNEVARQVEAVDSRNAEAYAVALLTEECGEVLQLLGKAGRFGMDTPGVKDALTGQVDMRKTPRTMLDIELGDLLAAISYAGKRGLIDTVAVWNRHDEKLQKLLCAESLDNLGRRLAP